MLYAFGSNGSGQLGVGHTDDLSKPAPTSVAHDAAHGRLTQLAAGGNHTLMLCEDGTVKATGNNLDGRCGIKDFQQTASFINVELPLHGDDRPLNVRQIAATWSSTIILCEDGYLYVCGTGNSGELGLGTAIENAPTWNRIPSFPPNGTDIIRLAASMAHIVVVLSNGEVYGWGKGRKGQLGEPMQDVWSPRRIDGFDILATKAVCGKDFTVIVGGPGSNHLKVLGSDRFGASTGSPNMINDCIGVSASWCSIYVLTNSGEIIAWGRSDRGQLPPLELPQLKALAAGSEHCLALTRAGKLLAWGWGEHGNCGLPTDDRGNVKGRWNEIEVPGRVTRIFTGCATSFVLTADE
jgi:protein ATS1